MQELTAFTEMTDDEKLEYINRQLDSNLDAKLCRIDEPNCEACQ